MPWVGMWLLVLWGGFLPAQTIEAIHFQGLKKTAPTYLHRFLESKVGMPYDSAVLARDVQTLRNLLFFERVQAEKRMTGRETAALVFTCQEVFTVLPFVDFGGVKGNRYVQVGALDVHWLGRGNQLGGFYRYDGRHSAQLFVKQPYLRGSSWGYSVSGLKLSTREPLFFNDPSGELHRINYLYDNYTLEALGRYEFSFRNFVELGGAYLFEWYRQLDQPQVPLEIPEAAGLHKIILKTSHTINRLDYYYHYLQGFYNWLNLESVITPGEPEPFWKILNVSKYFHRIGGKGNLALRTRLGLSPDRQSPFVPFVMDSYINIRGSGNRVARGTAELVLNLEYRHSVYENYNWGAIQAVAFVDMGTWRLPSPGRELFNPEYMSMFYGGGLRLYITKIYNFILRADYGISGFNSRQQGLVLGVGQYF